MLTNTNADCVDRYHYLQQQGIQLHWTNNSHLNHPSTQTAAAQQHSAGPPPPFSTTLRKSPTFFLTYFSVYQFSNGAPMGAAILSAVLSSSVTSPSLNRHPTAPAISSTWRLFLAPGMGSAPLQIIQFRATCTRNTTRTYECTPCDASAGERKAVLPQCCNNTREALLYSTKHCPPRELGRPRPLTACMASRGGTYLCQ